MLMVQCSKVGSELDSWASPGLSLGLFGLWFNWAQDLSRVTWMLPGTPESRGWLVTRASGCFHTGNVSPITGISIFTSNSLLLLFYLHLFWGWAVLFPVRFLGAMDSQANGSQPGSATRVISVGTFRRYESWTLSLCLSVCHSFPPNLCLWGTCPS